MRIASGQLFAFFSFDVGYEIDLERLRGEFPEGTRAAIGGGKKVAPAHVQYTTPPVDVRLDERDVALVDRTVRATVSLRLHEFGAVTTIFGMRFDDVDLASLPGITASLATGSTLETQARAVLREAFPRIASAVARPYVDVESLVEDYFVVQVSRFEPPVTADAMLADHADVLARALHCEATPLSATETEDVLRTVVVYTPHDLVVTDWNVALVYDEDYVEALNVLELLNVQLLELRFLDAMLDRRINAIYDQVTKPRQLFAFRRELVRVSELSELRIDTATLRERLTNALKLVGDLYLTKIYARTAGRLHLADWQRSVDGKLELIQKISDVFAERAATARAELLELTIIILIAVEIALFFAL